MQKYIDLLVRLLGVDDCEAFIEDLEKWLRERKTVFSNPYTRWSNSPRLINILSASCEFYRRIYNYSD